MPMLDAVHVPYYNPQVDEWFEELIEIETKAKEEAQLVLFVVDQLTRCLVSINEAVEFICRGRKVLLVVDNIKNGHDIEGKVLSPTELADLNGARQCLRDLATEKNVGLFPDVESAIDACIAHFAQLNIGKCQSKLPCRKKRDALTLKGRGICFDVTDDSEESYVGHGSLTSSQSIVKRPRLQWLGIYLRGSVYLGGNLTATSWRENVAIPMLHRAGIPVIVPVVD